MKNALKLLRKALWGLFLSFIILTFIISISKLTRPVNFKLDMEGLDELSVIKVQSKFDTSFTIVSITRMSTLKDNVIDYYKMLSKGDLGWIYGSIGTKNMYLSHELQALKDNMTPVSEVIQQGFSRSIWLILGALMISLVFGTLKGVYDSRKGKKQDSTLKLITTMLGLSIPDISVVWLLKVFIILLTRFVGAKFPLLPLLGDETFQHSILPIITLSILPTMYIARITSIALDGAYDHEYVRTAISKGASKTRVIWIHAFRNAIVEVAGSLPSVVTTLMSNLVIVEYLFHYRGLTFMLLDYYDKGESDAVTGIAITLYGIFLFFYLLFKLMKFSLDSKERRSTI